ncbi:MAG: hypothetical protein K6T83_14345 [Alicyclobacillus sp.]|nr:hypothetical protein [Alicyclobacillus sp.]
MERRSIGEEFISSAENGELVGDIMSALVGEQLYFERLSDGKTYVGIVYQANDGGWWGDVHHLNYVSEAVSPYSWGRMERFGSIEEARNFVHSEWAQLVDSLGQ